MKDQDETSEQFVNESAELRQRIAELERMVGRLTMQVEISKKASSLLDAPPTGEGRW